MTSLDGVDGKAGLESGERGKGETQRRVLIREERAKVGLEKAAVDVS